MNEKETVLKDIEELKKELKEAQEELKEAQKKYGEAYRKIGKEIQKVKQKVRCEKCKYCITDICACAFPHKNRTKCRSFRDAGTDLGATMRAEDTCTRAFNCEHYEEDGKSERSYSDLDEEIQDFWKKCYFNNLAHLPQKYRPTIERWEEWYQFNVVQYRGQKELKK